MAISNITVPAPPPFAFLKWFWNYGLLRNNIIGQPGVRLMSSQITSLAILRRGKAAYTLLGEWHTLFQVGEEPAVLFLLFGGKRTHNVHFLNTGCAMRLAGHFPPCHILLGEGSRGQDRKRQFSGWDKAFPGQPLALVNYKACSSRNSLRFLFPEVARGEW